MEGRGHAVRATDFGCPLIFVSHVIAKAVIYAAFIFAYFPMLASGNLVWIYAAAMLALAFDGTLYGPQAAFLAGAAAGPFRSSHSRDCSPAMSVPPEAGPCSHRA